MARLVRCGRLVSFENGIARGITGISGGFDNQIFGQIGRIAQLQQNGVNATQGGLTQGGLGQSSEQIVAQLNQNPALVPRAVEALRRDPQLMATALNELKNKPHLAAQLPAEMKGFLVQVLQSML